MKYRATSTLLLAYLMVQILSSYANAFELLAQTEDSNHHAAPVVAPEGRTEVHHMAQSDHNMKKSCSACPDGTHCLFSNCPLQPLEWQAPSRFFFTQTTRSISAVNTQEQYLDNLYRPPNIS